MPIQKEVQLDSRQEWIGDQIQNLFRNLKVEKFKKFISSEPFLNTTEDFFDNSDLLMMTIIDSNAGLQIIKGVPKNYNDRVIYFLKKSKDTVSEENMKQLLRVGVLADDPIGILRQTIESVYIPLLSSGQNQGDYNDLTVKEYNTIIYNYLSDIQIMQGQINGRTCLPLPPDDMSSHNTEEYQKERLHVLEGVIIIWSKQIKDVLKLDPDGSSSDSNIDTSTPLSELEFWRKKADNLNYIYQQLQSDRIRKILKYLDSNRSTYSAPFSKLCKEIYIARDEANNNALYLKALEPWFQKFQAITDYDEVNSFFRPVFHILLIIWRKSKYYNKPTRLVTMIRKLCNALIKQSCLFLTTHQLFEMIQNDEPQKAVKSITSILATCGYFKSIYFDYKSKSLHEAEGNPWKMDNKALFVRLDTFLERTHDLLTLTETMIQFNRLSKIEIGGTKGKTLTNSILQIFADFNTSVDQLKAVKYDLLDIDALQFDDLYFEFRNKIKELERRLSSIISQGFEDSYTLSGKFKLLFGFEGLLNRPIINEEMKTEQSFLLNNFSEDMKIINQIFIDNKNNPPIGNNLPPVAGSLMWSRSLYDRIVKPMDEIRQLSAELLEKEDSKEIMKSYTLLIANIKEYENNLIHQWENTIEDISEEKLKLPLLIWEKESNRIEVNFDPALVRLLREVKYLNLLELQIPDTAMALYQKNEVYRRYTGNLELIVNLYNTIQSGLLDIERPLLQVYLTKMEKILLPGSINMTWKSHGIENFINESMNCVKDCDSIYQTLKNNFNGIKTLLDSWNLPLIERDVKPLALKLVNSLYQTQLEKKYEIIREGGKKIQNLVKDVWRKLKISQGQTEWKNYIDYLSNIVVEGIITSVSTSLGLLNTQIECVNNTKGKTTSLPIIEIEMDLFNKEVHFIPSIIEIPSKDDIRDGVTMWVDGFIHISSLIKRLDSSTDANYIKEIESHDRIHTLLNIINNNFSQMLNRCNLYKGQFNKYSFLWTNNIDETFQKFILSILTSSQPILLTTSAGNDNASQDNSQTLDEIPSSIYYQLMKFISNRIKLNLFDEKITFYKNLLVQVEEINNIEDKGFLRINCQPLKQAISSLINKWLYVYINYLENEVQFELDTISKWISELNQTLDKEIKFGDDEELKTCIQDIKDIKQFGDYITSIFEPIKDVFTLLNKYNITCEDILIDNLSVNDYLESVPLFWNKVVDKAYKKKEIILPLQNNMSGTIRKDVLAFKESVILFRTEMQKSCPYNNENCESDSAYKILDSYADRLKQMTEEGLKLNHLENLFDLEQSRYIELFDSKQDIIYLKLIWDLFALINCLFVDWKNTLWNTINTDILLNDIKLLQKQLVSLPKFIHPWPIYVYLYDFIKNLSLSLPLINDLHNESMKERHWKILSTITHKPINKGPDFSLNDVLKLNLHEHIEDVQETVELSIREQKIEKKLSIIEEVWNNATVEYVENPDFHFKLINISNATVEVLEDHELQLQNISSMGKYIDFFKERIDKWIRLLSDVESVFRIWGLVQSKWLSLENIYMHSLDIQTQLPADTKRFKTIDQTYRTILENSYSIPLIINACTKDGLNDSLNAIYKDLEKCQKSLDEYLETKKAIFPRFYFVSNPALLDILSNGNNAPRIERHFNDCFCGINALRYIPNSQDKSLPPVNASHMISKENEIIELSELFTIQGQVECWLNDLLLAMRNSLKYILDLSLDAAGQWIAELPREKWLFHYPAQIVLLVSQIMYTQETENSLNQMENGSEDAMKTYLGICSSRLDSLIKLVQGNLSESDRTKIITLITMDVHNRDIIQKLIDLKVDSVGNFQWKSQLRFYPTNGTCIARIIDYQTEYAYEYLGNTDRLVITPLTDRCYITLSVALKLNLGGAPAGPAGTGKTETTKDLARSLGLACYVFNCSDQMNYQTLGNIFKGLSQSGAWGCFDEFNRICIEVLSVVATQVKSILDAIKYLSNTKNRDDKYQNLPDGKPGVVVGTFEFMGNDIKLIPTVGIFITMNPGYAGRTELPENIKTLFRSCAMIRPDLVPICENMLMSEGFVKARTMSIKFVTLYKLCSELLSQQIHYDWGLRAVKSVLRVAGMLKRAEPTVNEDIILMRALRDFNIPKIISTDLPIFLRLISDLFPNMQIAAKVNEELKNCCIESSKLNNIVSDEEFVLKVVQLKEIIDVRHSVMILGPAGSGKSTVWKSLCHSFNYNQKKTICAHEVVNPKSITSDELFGFMNLSKDWTDGAFSIIMRNMAKNCNQYNENQKWKFIVLDGDIDAVWIESMNTVMDDNKVLTLVSNERIPLTPVMRLIFEVNTLKNATPATVSRAGILYINDTDIGYKPIIESWLNTRVESFEISNLPRLFSTFIDEFVSQVQARKYQYIVPIPLVSVISSVLRLLDSYLTDFKPKTQEMLEMIFFYSCVWGFGSALEIDKNTNYWKKFDDMYRSSFKKVLFPVDGLIFDYTLSLNNGQLQLIPWKDVLPTTVPSLQDTILSNVLVHTIDTVRLSTIATQLMLRHHPIMLVGPAGTGKTLLIKDILRNQEDTYNSVTINCNYYTDSHTMQLHLEDSLDKRSGRIYGPIGTKRLVYYIDDLNMTQVESYGTQTSIELLRQYIDYGNWFDRSDLSLRKTIVDIQFITSMNNKAGSFTINPRYQWHYSTFIVPLPEMNELNLILTTLFSTHLGNVYSKKVIDISTGIVNASIELYQIISEKFLPTAIKFHYNFNMRDLRNIFQQLLLIQPEYYNAEPLKLTRLFIHECDRVYKDRFTNEKDIRNYETVLIDIIKKHFDEEIDTIMEKPIIYTHFASNIISDQPPYLPVASYKELNDFLTVKLQDYNNTHNIIDLVLFEQAMDHITHLCRILSTPQGNGLLIGVGGSGKQSICRLSSFIVEYDIIQSNNVNLLDFKDNLRELYRKAGVKPALPLVYLLTENQIYDEKYLVFINDFLSSGNILDLYNKDEIEGICNSLKNLAKSLGIADNRKAMTDFFINRVKENLHVILCFSPVGDQFRIRCRKFPGLINCTTIDWYHSWSQDSLLTVSNKFIADLPIENGEMIDNIVHYIAEVHLSVTNTSNKYLSQLRRYNYTTPKTYLNFIQLYKSLLKSKKNNIDQKIETLSSGLKILRETADEVEQLQKDLNESLIKVDEKKRATDALLTDMGKQRELAEKQQQIASIERKKATEAKTQADAIEKEAQEALLKAKPALLRAKDAVNCLNKASLTELKSMISPPAAVLKVTTTVLMMLRNEKKNFSWDNSKRMMAKIDQFKKELEEYPAETIPDDVKRLLEPYLADSDFNETTMSKKSIAAANLVVWVVNIIHYNSVYVKVKPLMDRLDAAQQESAKAEEQLAAALNVVKEATDNLAQLQTNFLEASNEKAKVEAEASNCQKKLDLAERLVSGLSSEKERWGKEIDNYHMSSVTLVGDCLLGAAFISYIGAFTSSFRSDLWKDIWISDLESREIPIKDEIDPVSLLASDTEIAEYLTHSLPSDRLSIENAVIIANSERYPLLIDPQLQGIKWLRDQFEKEKLVNFRIGQKSWIKLLQSAIQEGCPCLIDNIGEVIDPVLEPILSRSYFKKGHGYFMRIDGNEIEYNHNFKLFFQTKISNPEYKPEVQAQCTLINFIVTESGLEDQLLAAVVRKEQPALEDQKQELQMQLNQYKIQLSALEEELLQKIANAPDDILSDISLIESLELTKKTVNQINEAVDKAKVTELQINEARNVYRSVANEGSILYFIANHMNVINPLYQYSLSLFLQFFLQSLDTATTSEVVDKRITSLKETLRFIIYRWLSRGLFESDKIILLCEILFKYLTNGIIGKDTGFTAEYLNYLIKSPKKVMGEENPIEWLTETSWYSLQALSSLTDFERFAGDVAENSQRFREWYNQLNPETEKLPLDWRELDKTPFKKLLVIRSLRPDRLVTALITYIKEILPHGIDFVNCDSQFSFYQITQECYRDSSSTIPLYFILSSGSDIVTIINKMSEENGKMKNISYFYISLGQGQEKIAMDTVDQAAQNGYWVLLNNLHLMPKWLIELDKKLDELYLNGCHNDFRLFLASEPSNNIPIGILNKSIKLTNEPPTGLKSNMKRSISTFTADDMDCLDAKTRGILFGLCYFHSILIERKTYGSKGFNMLYPFSVCDLQDSAVILNNYMETAPVKIPWDDLRYIFGEIMYGGHIVNDFDRLLCNKYLEYYLKDELLEEIELVPYCDQEDMRLFSIKAPPPTTYANYVSYLEKFPAESPVYLGLHSNTEIDLRSTICQTIFTKILLIEPKGADTSAETETAGNVQSTVEITLQEILDVYRDFKYDLDEIRETVPEPGPFQNVFIQEFHSMNLLVNEMVVSLEELEMGYNGELQMSEKMDILANQIYNSLVPPIWEVLAYPSLRPLASWLQDLGNRIQQFNEILGLTLEVPRVTWLSGFFNPQSFLTSITQVTAQKKSLELDKLVIQTEIQKKYAHEIDIPSREGYYIHGLFMEGARFDITSSTIMKSFPKELYSALPVINCKAVPLLKGEAVNTFYCPIYRTQNRGPTYIFSASVRTVEPADKWILGGVVMVLDVV